MTEESNEAEVNTNALEMSDEAFNELMLDDYYPTTDATSESDDEINKSDDELADSEDVSTSETDEIVESDEDDSENEAETNEDETDEDEEKDGTDESEDQTDKDEVSDEVGDTTEEKPLTEAEQLLEIFAPFKANGKEMTVDNVADIRSLMQMGANYNKKMAGLKPNLKLMKMLDNNGLLDEAKINFLIDLDKKNPAAVTQLLKDSKLDPEDIDIETEISYKPNTYTVNDKEVELDDTLNEIRDTPSYAQTLTIISNKWDESSRVSLLDNPAGIKVLNDHVESGIYDKITSAVETERMFGRIPAGTSDLDAYRQVGDAINAAGGFNTSASTLATKTVSGKPTTKVDPKINSKKKAASSTKSSSKSVAKKEFNPLSMSDAEFEKMEMSKYI